jgi:hypothetical protein
VEVTSSFPEECRFVLETLGEVYGYDDQARTQCLSPEQRYLTELQRHAGELKQTPFCLPAAVALGEICENDRLEPCLGPMVPYGERRGKA